MTTVQKQTAEYWEARAKFLEAAIGKLPESMRKRIIRQASGSAGGRTRAANAATSKDMGYGPKLAQDDEAVRYQATTPQAGQFCGNCVYFLGDRTMPFGACSVVGGPIMQAGRCDLWEGIEQIAAPDGEMHTEEPMQPMKPMKPMGAMEEKTDVAKPFGPYENFDACMTDQMGKGHDEEEARRICGAMMREMEKAESGAVIVFPVHGDLAKSLHVEGGVPLPDMHITLAYLGDASSLDDSAKAKVKQVVKQMAGEGPIHVQLGKVKTFPDNGSGRAAHVEVMGPALMTFRSKLVKALKEADIEIDTTFREYRPHITLKYLKDGEDIPDVQVPSGDILLDQLGVWMAGQHEEMRMAGAPTEKSVFVAFLKADEERRLVTGIVLQPDVVDSQRDVVSADDIETAMHRFMETSRRIFIQHSTEAPKVQVVESFIARENMEMGGEQVKKGSWLMTVKVHDDDLWGAVKRGEYTGFSIRGKARREPVGA